MGDLGFDLPGQGTHANPFTDIASIVKGIVGYIDSKTKDREDVPGPDFDLATGDRRGPRHPVQLPSNPKRGGDFIPIIPNDSKDDENNTSSTSNLFPSNDRVPDAPLVGVESNPGPKHAAELFNLLTKGKKKKKTKKKSVKIVEKVVKRKVKGQKRRRNTLSNPQNSWISNAPGVLNTKVDQMKVFEGSEMVSDMISGPATNFGNFKMLFSQLISPTNTAICPQLAIEAKQWEFYLFDWWAFEFDPNVAPTSSGMLYMAYDLDVTDPAPARATEMSAKKPLYAAQRVIMPMSLRCPGSMCRIVKPNKYAINPIPGPNSTVDSTSHCAKYYLGTSGLPSGTLPLGSLTFKYRIKFFQRSELPTDVDAAVETWSASPPVFGSAVSIFGNTRTIKASSSTIGIGWTDVTQTTAANRICVSRAGTYLIEGFYFGTNMVLPIVTSVLSTNWAVVTNVSGGGYITFGDLASGSATTAVLRVVLAPVAGQTISFDTNATMDIVLANPGAGSYSSCQWLVTPVREGLSAIKPWAPISFDPLPSLDEELDNLDLEEHDYVEQKTTPLVYVSNSNTPQARFFPTSLPPRRLRVLP